jgi:hypothetical protein
MICKLQVLSAASVVALAFGFLPGDPSGADILRRVEQQVAGVKDYTVTLDVVADIEHLKVPPMHATLYFKQPDKVHIASKGFAMLPRESMGMQFSKLTERYAVDSLTTDRKSSSVIHRLVMHPRDERSSIRRILLFVHGERWTPERIEIPQSGGAVMKAAFTYQNASGSWMPSQLIVTFAMGTADSTAAVPANPFGGGQGTRAASRGAGRSGTITVKYTEYLVNTGLVDEVFVETGEPK